MAITLSRVAAGQYAGTDADGNTWSVFRQETASGEGYGAGRLWLWCNDATGEHSDPLPTKAAAAGALNAYLPGRTLDETWGWVYREGGR